MKIAIVTTWWSGAGAGEVSLAFAKVLLKSGHDIYIYARHESSFTGDPHSISPSESNIKIWHGKKSNSPLIKSVHSKDFVHFLKSNLIDLVIFNEQVDLTPVIAAKRAGIRCVAYVDYYREDTVNSFEIYDALICNTKRHFDVFRWHENAWFLPWGVDPSIYEGIEIQESADEFPFFHSCSYDPKRKGTDILLRSLEKFKDLRCTIHAYPSLSQTLPEERNLIEKLKNEGRLREINRLVRQPGLYSMGRIYVYPSRLEGIGLSILEAQATGLHLVAPNVDPFSDLAVPFGSTLVSPKTCRTRADAYYWPIAEVDSEDLGFAMNQALEHIRSNPSHSEDIRNYVFSKRNIYLTHESLAKRLDSLGFKSIKSSDIKSLMNVSTQKIPVTYNGRFKKFFLQLRHTILQNKERF
jgi:glycosyltransferase involved in cell wall biosynthesis